MLLQFPFTMTRCYKPVVMATYPSFQSIGKNCRQLICITCFLVMDYLLNINVFICIDWYI